MYHNNKLRNENFGFTNCLTIEYPSTIEVNNEVDVRGYFN